MLEAALQSLMFRDVVFAFDWEDPASQDRALGVTPDDHVLTITAGGCNALNLALASPARLVCVDGNAAQTHLLELKIAAARELPHADFFDIFAARRPQRMREVFGRLRPLLSARARTFWDKHVGVIAGGLYGAGRIGLYLRIVRAYLRAIGLSPAALTPLLDAPDLDAQHRFYDEHLGPRMNSRIARRILRSRLLNYLSGMHPEQLARVEREGGFDTNTLARLERVLRDVPVRDNYFLAIAATGAFRGDRVPPYLRAESYDRLRAALDRVEPITSSVDPLLERLPPRSLTKINLLDVFDWMTHAEVEATLERVARVAAPGATVLYRSALVRLDPPAAAMRHFVLDRDVAGEILRTERGIIHGSAYVLRRVVH